ncbi:hypothetical protein JS756_28865 [Streptomyces actuosus]|uniref:Uncharacterized protein n=1 Tax=Streptomyces actuosus TaxID=1885 RepID=A0ABS2VYD3_STRAS|nr:hypothetical protein [Streptomyces actuosus]MBN0048053.1 hypothetical protein [Streptomyces actuosus]
MALVACAVMTGGIAAWFATRDDSPDFCHDLSKNGKIRRLLDAAHQAESTCAALGGALKKAAVRDGAEDHSIKQAQAMKDALLAVEDQMRRTGTTSLDEDFSEPFAEALADYSTDIYGILAPGSFDYSRHDSPSDPPWADEDGVHMAIFQKPLMRVMRGISATPAAYVELRRGVTRTAVHELAATPNSAVEAADPSGAEGPSAPKANGWVLGSLDAVADEVTARLTQEAAADWENRVRAGLAQGLPENVPPYGEDPERNILVTWQKTVASSSDDSLTAGLHMQGPVLVKAWGEGIRLGGEKISSLSEGARFSAESARSTMLHSLD